MRRRTLTLLISMSLLVVAAFAALPSPAFASEPPGPCTDAEARAKAQKKDQQGNLYECRNVFFPIVVMNVPLWVLIAPAEEQLLELRDLKSGLLLTPDVGQGGLLREQPRGGPRQKWDLFAGHTALGSFRLINHDTGMCIGVRSGSTGQGADVLQWACNGNPDQDWFLVSTGQVNPFANGPDLWIQNVHSGLVFAMQSGNTTAGTKVVQWGRIESATDQKIFLH